MNSRRGALMATLFVAQVLGSTGHSIIMAVGGILAAAITGTNTWVGVPVAVGALGSALASWPLSRLMGWLYGPGRRSGAARLAKSQMSGRVSRGSMISSIQNVSAERKGERSLVRRSSISAIFSFGSAAASISAR